MLFSQSLLAFSANAEKPSVLALYSDHFIGEVRVKPMLNALLARGVIGDYQIADRQMELVGPLKQHRFTHIWCQRNVSTRQFSFLKRHQHVPIIYDLDDLLTSPPDFVINTRTRTTSRIAWCLQHAKVVTVTSERLARCLREDVPSSAEMVVIKNGHAGLPAPPSDEVRRQLVWASGDRPYVLRDEPSFIERLADLTRRHKYQAVLLGRFEREHLGLFDDHMPSLDFASYREFLRTCAGAIGLAPLPMGLSNYSQRYFDAKSDIKLVDFLISGILPLYSAAAPYADSDLFDSKLAAAKPNELLAKVEAAMADPRTLGLIGHDGAALDERAFRTLSQALDRFFV